jgi:hypothetical protein
MPRLSYRDLTEPIGQPAFERDDGAQAQRIPESWADYRHEPVERDAGEVRWYAVAIVHGVLVNEPRTAPAIQTLYVREDNTRAFEQAHVAERTESGWLPNPAEWASSVGERPTVGGEVDDDQRETFARFLAELHDVDVDDRADDEPAREVTA